MSKETKTEKRAPRAQETRMTKKAKTPWKPPSMLEVPNDPPAGMVYRWIRAETLGQEDRTNVSKGFVSWLSKTRRSSGYDYPTVDDGRHAGVIGVGGLILCKNRRRYRRTKI